MITGCPQCGRKTRQIDASVYAGDYHQNHDYAPGRQCVDCGTVYEVNRIGKSVRLQLHEVNRLPPRNKWEEPRL
jgi:hypothetical protein